MRTTVVVVLAVLSPVGGATEAPGGAPSTNVRLVNVLERARVEQVLEGAARRFARPECQQVIDDFGLRSALEASGVSTSEYLRRHLFFYDAPARACGSTSILFVMPSPGSQAVLVCGTRLRRGRNSLHAEVVVIHEMLHSLGLGENPPSSEEISARVLARCQ